jgi:hypothetical protein
MEGKCKPPETDSAGVRAESPDSVAPRSQVTRRNADAPRFATEAYFSADYLWPPPGQAAIAAAATALSSAWVAPSRA